MVIFIQRSPEELEAQRVALLARLGGCEDETCPHHGDDLDQLDTVLFLLGER
jgi:hypothetical protein